MFFRSARAICLAVILLIVGGFLLVKGQYYLEVSKRESTTIGILNYASHGKSSIYRYKYRVNGVLLQDDSDTCRTALTAAGCIVGAPVLVYYDRNQVTDTLLAEFADAGRGKIFLGGFMVACGVLLLVLVPVSKKYLASPDESPDIDYEEPADGPDVIHVTPQT